MKSLQRHPLHMLFQRRLLPYPSNTAVMLFRQYPADYSRFRSQSNVRCTVLHVRFLFGYLPMQRRRPDCFLPEHSDTLQDLPHPVQNRVRNRIHKRSLTERHHGTRNQQLLSIRSSERFHPDPDYCKIRGSGLHGLLYLRSYLSNGTDSRSFLPDNE